jgi:hypothetical protein
LAAFYLDHDVSFQVAGALRRLPAHSVITTRDMGMESAKDPDQLLLAAERRWVLVSHNRKDFRLLHRAWHLWTTHWRVPATHAGILIIPHDDFNASARRLDDFVSQSMRMFEGSLRDEWIETP